MSISKKSLHARIITGYGAAFFATVIWSGNFIVARLLAESIPPCQLNFWRSFVALFTLLPFALPHLKKDFRIFTGNILYFSIMALLGGTLMNIFIYTAGHSTSSLNMSLIMPATPVVILIFARLIYKTPITFSRVVGMITAFAGILFLVCKGDFQKFLQLDFTGGDLWTLCGMFTFAFFSLFQKQRPAEISSIGFNVIIFALGSLFSLPFMLSEIFFLHLARFSMEIAIGVLYTGLGCSAMAFWLWTSGIDRIGPVASGIVYYSLPVYTAIMAHFILGETVTSAQLIGGGMIIAGILLTSIQLPQKRTAAIQV